MPAVVALAAPSLPARGGAGASTSGAAACTQGCRPAPRRCAPSAAKVPSVRVKGAYLQRLWIIFAEPGGLLLWLSQSVCAQARDPPQARRWRRAAHAGSAGAHKGECVARSSSCLMAFLDGTANKEQNTTCCSRVRRC